MFKLNKRHSKPTHINLPLCSAPHQMEIGTLPPPDHSYGVPEASLEEEEEERGHEEELPLKPQHVPQGSGDSGVLMGPNTQKGQNEHMQF